MKIWLSRYVSYFAQFLLISFLIVEFTFNSFGQNYFLTEETLEADSMIFENRLCGCSIELIGHSVGWNGEISYSPENLLYCLGNVAPGDVRLYLIDPETGNTSGDLMTGPAYLPPMMGFVAVGNGIFYSQPHFFVGSDTIYRWDLNSSTVASLGTTGFIGDGAMAMSGGEVYYLVRDAVTGMRSIVKLDQLNPSNSTIMVTFPFLQNIAGLTASPYCNILIGTDVFPDNFVAINLLDGSIEPICHSDDVEGLWITSMWEYTPLDCSIYIDLDCNDSSGATGSDYNSTEYTCLTSGVGIADEDIKMFFDDIVTSMTIRVDGNVPDAPEEILEMTGSVPNIDVTGAGTNMITLTNVGGAKSTDFKDALRLIVYKDLAAPSTPGPRTVEVQFTTASGAMSNIATAFIEVISLPLVDVDLGPDQFICEGEATIFDAGIPGADYTWSTGVHTQTISAFESGQYTVTVADGVNCPGMDTVELNVVPVIQVALEGDFEICDNESAELIIQTTTPFSLTVDISSNPGSPFHFTGINEDFTFNDFPTQTTVYTITNVSASDSACFELTDPVQIVDVYPTFTTTMEATICEGDSIFLGFNWENEPGVYVNTFDTHHGCDSVVTTTLSVLPSIQIVETSTTCDSAAAGVFVAFLHNPGGCDTMVTTTVTLLPSDTMLINLHTCQSSNAGTTTQVLSNQSGCDSLIITTTSWIPPSDTTIVTQTTCDSALLGVFEEILTDQSGCDSLIITFVNMGISDTTLIHTTSCDSSSLGVFESHFTTAHQCDSTVITTVTFSSQDSTFITGGSCDPAEVGVFIQLLTNRLGCDSIVTTTISLLPNSETFISGTTCDPGDAGDFEYILLNQFGCDSIVHETISLLPPDSTFLTSTTCTSSQAGTFITTLQNEFGCDSIVTLMVSLIPSDTTQLISMTCDPAQVGSTQITYTNQVGCDSLVIQSIELFPLPNLNVQVISDFNGYGVSCFGESDGSVTAEATGVGPFEYLWSTGSPDQSITGLSSGDYYVTIIDGNGCQTNSSVYVSKPEEFSIGFEVSQPDCFDHLEGSITVMPSGGLIPIRYSIDGINFQFSTTFNNLSGGTYQVTALDANDCEIKEIIWINVPLMVHVDLGDDMIILPGETTIIEAIVNVPFDSLSSVNWSGLTHPACPTCLTQPVAPIITTTYSVTVASHDGCVDADSMTLLIESNNDLYIPNIFSPNGDNINDLLLLSSGSGVEEIEYMEIFDRWGNIVFMARNFPPGDPAYAWDGSRSGVTMNPAVYAYSVVIRWKDGRRELRNGDVTLIR
jgi:gliding motility-associated-like protein